MKYRRGGKRLHWTILGFDDGKCCLLHIFFPSYMFIFMRLLSFQFFIHFPFLFVVTLYAVRSLLAFQSYQSYICYTIFIYLSIKLMWPCFQTFIIHTFVTFVSLAAVIHTYVLVSVHSSSLTYRCYFPFVHQPRISFIKLHCTPYILLFVYVFPFIH